MTRKTYGVTSAGIHAIRPFLQLTETTKHPAASFALMFDIRRPTNRRFLPVENQTITGCSLWLDQLSWNDRLNLNLLQQYQDLRLHPSQVNRTSPDSG